MTATESEISSSSLPPISSNSSQFLPLPLRLGGFCADLVSGDLLGKLELCNWEFAMGENGGFGSRFKPGRKELIILVMESCMEVAVMTEDGEFDFVRILVHDFQVRWGGGHGEKNTTPTVVIQTRSRHIRQRKKGGEVEEQEQEEEGEVYGEKEESSSSSLRHMSCRCFSLDHIRLATNNFDESLVIGEGGFGKVYKGIIDAGADPVAIKRLSFSSSQGVTEFRTELELLSKFRHSHLVSLVGYCEARPEMILVYEYMRAGSLSDHLHKDRRLKSGHSPLSWVHRLNICIDAARGLDYLHTGTSIKERVIHRDVKSSNILLDENFAAKVSDFGLSRIAPVNPWSTNCIYTNNNKGTIGYMDLESFYTHRVTRKSDVYAFGVVLFEVLCGRPAVDSSLDDKQCGLAGWARNCVKEGTINQIIDPFIRGEILPGCLEEFVHIAYKCLDDRSNNRPTVAHVVARLESALAIQEGRDVVARVESGLALQDGRISPVLEQQVASPTTSHPGALHDKNWTGNITKRTRKMRFTRKMWSLFSPKLPAVSAESSTRGAIDEISNNRESVQYNFSAIKAATIDFSANNKLGEGGFGKVFEPDIQGRLQNGQDVAVKRLSRDSGQGDLDVQDMGEVSTIESLQYSFSTIRAATKDFSKKLGEDPFGTVYKGRLIDGQDIAVTRLPNIYGLDDIRFKNEVALLARLRHKNLIRLLGFSLSEAERLLIYKFMPNSNLYHLLFGQTKHRNLDWHSRSKIIDGLAKGLSYLHEDSGQTIIYRHLSSRGIVLDAEMNPMIADSYTARMFTLPKARDISPHKYWSNGYTAPEYVNCGQFSVKSDIYSFGVLVLEIVTGKQFEDFRKYVWENIPQGTPLDMIDPKLRDDTGSLHDVMRKIHIGLLCIQEEEADRPTIGSVVTMLNNFLLEIPPPIGGLTFAYIIWEYLKRQQMKISAQQ